MSGTKPELRALTSLRGFAAMAVVMQHFSATAQWHSLGRIPSLVPHGYIAVDFFFVLSGFIMSYIYLESFEQREPGAYLDFLGKRVARIVPLQVGVTLAIVLGGVLTQILLDQNLFFKTRAFWYDFVTNLMMLPGVGYGSNFNGPSWSISVEFVAYLIFPALVVLAFSRFGAVRLLLLVSSLAYVVAMESGSVNFHEGDGAIWQNQLRCLAEFSMGMLVYGIYRDGRWRVFGSDESVILLLGGVAFSLIMRTDFPAIMLFPFVVLACARNDGTAARVLGSPIPYFLGVISFSLYLVHNMMRWPLLFVVKQFHPERFTLVEGITFAFVGSMLVIPVAWVAYETIERPGRRWVRLLLRTRLRAA